MPEWLSDLLARVPLPDGWGDVSSAFTDAAAWSAIVGVASPWLIALVQQPQWSVRLRKVVAVVVSALLGLGTSAATGALADGPVSALGAFAIVLVASQTTYKNLAQRADGKPMRTETATSPRTSTEPEPDETPADQPDRPVHPPVRPPDPPEEEESEYAEPLGPDSRTVVQVLERLAAERRGPAGNDTPTRRVESP